MKVITTIRSKCGRVAVQVRQDDIWGEYYTFTTVDWQISKTAPVHHSDTFPGMRSAAVLIAETVSAKLPPPLAIV